MYCCKCAGKARQKELFSSGRAILIWTTVEGGL
jgi:hypothetical protein